MSHSDDTVDLPRLEADGQDAGKRCCNCGKDLKGHRRFKDSVGYWCKDCHKVDRQRNIAPEGRCPDCGRMRPLDKLITAEDGAAICSSCMKERAKKAEKYAVKAMVEEQHESHERRKIYIYAAIVIFLVLLIVFQQLRKFF